MKKLFENVYEHRGEWICRNYGGWVIVDGHCWKIFKRLSDAKNYMDKQHDSTRYYGYGNGWMKDIITIGEMNKEQFINAANVFTAKDCK